MSPDIKKKNSIKLKQTKKIIKRVNKKVNKKVNKTKTKISKVSHTSHKLSLNTKNRISAIRKRITRKDVRKYEVERVGKIINIYPKFVKFYNKLSNDEIIAIKYYKGFGSIFQTKLLTNEDKPREISFPFDILEENMFRKDVYGEGAELYPMLKSFDMKDIPNYIKNNYKARIEILNRLDNIYNKPDCPHLTGEEILFRGMTAPPNLKKCKAGDSFLFKNFMSSSADRNVAEMYSDGDTLLIFTGMKDIPYIYMPNSKVISSGNTKYTKLMGNINIFRDFSEHTLPRNLEFKIDKIEDAMITWTSFKKNNNKYTTLSSLEKLLKRKGLINSSPEEQKDTIEQSIYSKFKIYYCSFLKWHPREPINYEDIMNDAKFVLDKEALNSWNRKYIDDD